MSHIGLITPPYVSHVNSMIILGGELLRRGHRVSLISTPDAEKPVLAGGLEFIAVGAGVFPPGTLERFTDKQGRLSGIRAIRFIMKDIAKIAAMHAQELPDAVLGNGIDALVVDQIQPIGAAVAQRYDLPYVNVCSLLPLNSDPNVPPWTMYWPFEDSDAARTRNKIGYRVRSMFEHPLTVVANGTRVKWGLDAVTADGSFSKLAQLAQIPAFFDFPRRQTPEAFHYTGPFHDYKTASPVPFPWEALDGRPLIYAAMGTMQNRMMRIFRTIAQACEVLDAQLVISLGSRGAAIPADFPGSPIVVDFAPQLELLKRASLFISHGGANSTLEAMAYGVPMVLLPVTSDQPGVAARAKHVGVAEFIPVNKLSAGKLRTAIETVRSNPSYRDSALKAKEVLSVMDPVGRAADIVEEAFQTRRPVRRTTPI